MTRSVIVASVVFALSAIILVSSYVKAHSQEMQRHDNREIVDILEPLQGKVYTQTFIMDDLVNIRLLSFCKPNEHSSRFIVNVFDSTKNIVASTYLSTCREDVVFETIDGGLYYVVVVNVSHFRSKFELKIEAEFYGE